MEPILYWDRMPDFNFVMTHWAVCSVPFFCLDYFTLRVPLLRTWILSSISFSLEKAGDNMLTWLASVYLAAHTWVGTGTVSSVYIISIPSPFCPCGSSAAGKVASADSSSHSRWGWTYSSLNLSDIHSMVVKLLSQTQNCIPMYINNYKIRSWLSNCSLLEAMKLTEEFFRFAQCVYPKEQV